MASKIKVTVGEQSWAWSLEVTLADAFLINQETGLGVLGFHQGVFNWDPHCCQTLVWMCRRQAEPTLKRKDVQFTFGGDFTIEDLDDEVPTSEPSNLTALTATTAPAETNGSTPSPVASPA